MSGLGLAYGSDDDDDHSDHSDAPAARLGGGLGLGGYGSDDEDGRPKASELESTGEAATVEVAVSAEDDHDDDSEGSLLPKRPSGAYDPAVEQTVMKLINVAKAGDINAHLQSLHQFRNPSMYEKLVEQMDINECGSNCSPDQYDPNRWAPEDFYDKLEEARKAADQARLKARASAARPEIQFERASGAGQLKPKLPAGVMPMPMPGMVPAMVPTQLPVGQNAPRLPSQGAVSVEVQRKRAEAKRKAELMMSKITKK